MAQTPRVLMRIHTSGAMRPSAWISCSPDRPQEASSPFAASSLVLTASTRAQPRGHPGLFRSLRRTVRTRAGACARRHNGDSCRKSRPCRIDRADPRSRHPPRPCNPAERAAPRRHRQPDVRRPVDASQQGSWRSRPHPYPGHRHPCGAARCRRRQPLDRRPCERRGGHPADAADRISVSAEKTLHLSNSRTPQMADAAGEFS